MELKIKDLIELFEVPEKTIMKWIKDKKIPAYKINNEYWFNKAEINDWILKMQMNVSSKIFALNLTNKPVVMFDLFNKGGFYYNIKGDNVKDIIKDAVQIIPTPEDISKDMMYSLLIQREEMMPTSIGRGIAIPHARNPIVSDIENENIATCFLNKPIDYNAIDNKPVHTLFIIMSALPKRHLEILSKLSFFCQQEDFMKLLKKQAKKEEILKYVQNVEGKWIRKIN